MRIAILGTRGIPANYGGFETCAEEISVRLAERGHQVTVYCESENPSLAPSEYKGVKLVQIPKLGKQVADYLLSGFTATSRSILSNADVLHFFGCDYVPFTLMGRLSGKGVVLTLDGLEWRRKGYPSIFRAYLRSFAELAMVFPHASIVDSRTAQRWYFERTGKEPQYVPYGTNLSSDIDSEVLKKFGLAPRDYILFVGRLVYEKGAHTLIDAFKPIKTNLKLVIIGDSISPSDYAASLKDNSDKRIRFLGFVHGPEFTSLRNAALIYVHPSLFDGTSISLLGALGSGKCVVSSDIPENADVGGDAVAYFEKGNPEGLRARLEELIQRPEEIKRLEKRACDRAENLLSWDVITNKYEEAYSRSLKGSHKSKIAV